MTSIKTVQALVLLLVLAMAASCEITRQYGNRLFATHERTMQPAGATPQFLHSGTDSSTSNWVSTDIIMGRDSSRTASRLDELTAIVPASLPAGPPKTHDSLTRSSVALQTPSRTEPGRGVRMKRSRD